MRQLRGDGGVGCMAGCAVGALLMLIIPFMLGVYGHDNDLIKPTGGSVAGEGGCLSPLTPSINNKAALGDAINAYIQSLVPRSPLVGAGDNFVNAGVEHGINPMWVVVIAQKESSFGTAGIATKGTNNSFGRTATDAQPGVVIKGRRWYKYSSFQDSPFEQSAYLKRRYIDQGLTTMREIVYTYAPPSENNTEQYIKDIERSMGKLAALAGSALECSGTKVAGSGTGKYLNVPGVKEATGGDCGQASTIMVILYYRPSYQDSRFYNSATNSTRDNLACVSPAYINQQTRQNDWRYATSQQAGLENVKRSLAGGDPVIIYTRAGSVYSSSKHIFVIVGYDESDDTFIVNNPYVRGVEVHTKTPNGKQMTSQHLKSHFGDSTYGHTFMIKGKYLK